MCKFNNTIIRSFVDSVFPADNQHILTCPKSIVFCSKHVNVGASCAGENMYTHLGTKEKEAQTC